MLDEISVSVSVSVFKNFKCKCKRKCEIALPYDVKSKKHDTLDLC